MRMRMSFNILIPKVTFRLHQRRNMKASGLALLGIVMMIGIVAKHCEGLTIPTVDHFPLINAG